MILNDQNVTLAEIKKRRKIITYYDRHGFYRDFDRLQWFSAFAVKLRHGHENQRNMCIVSI